MNENKNRHTVWLTDETWSKVKDHYRADNCSTQNEYIEKAIQFYSGYLDTEQADSYLPRVIAEVLEGKLNALGSRVGKLLFKLSVDDVVIANLIAAIADVDLDTLKKMRVKCIKPIWMPPLPETSSPCSIWSWSVACGKVSWLPCSGLIWMQITKRSSSVSNMSAIPAGR